ncbi:MAG TPA: hypothetical protein VJU86_15900 [Pyrinomonadaceae bacterium]|nr:hypothetical protein [Pyrinomonadaceae bacterium]
MTDAPSETTSVVKASRVTRAILSAWLVAGVLDGLAASINAWVRGTSPARVFQYISSGILGAASFSGGFATVALGIALHFLVALGAAVLFVLASLRFPILIRRAIIFGIVYGIAVYFFMSRIVVPLSAVRRSPFSLQQLVIGLVIHILCVGLPIALMTRRALHSKP